MRLSPVLLRLSRGPALLALALPLAVALAFSDETLDKVPKSEGYCSRILRVQGTRREGYTEFSLRVEGDPDFYKPGTSYRGKWPAVVLGARDLAPRRAPTAQCRRRAHGSQAHGASAARRGPFCPGCPILSAPSQCPAPSRGRSQEMQPPSPKRCSRVWVGAERRVTLAWLPPRAVSGERWRLAFLQIRFWGRGDLGFF